MDAGDPRVIRINDRNEMGRPVVDGPCDLSGVGLDEWLGKRDWEAEWRRKAKLRGVERAGQRPRGDRVLARLARCLLYTSDAADE